MHIEVRLSYKKFDSAVTKLTYDTTREVIEKILKKYGLLNGGYVKVVKD